MASYGYMAKIGVDTSGLQAGLKEINSQIKSTDSELYKVNKTIKNAASTGTDSTEMLKQKSELLNNGIAETEKKLKELKSVEEQMQKALAANPEWEAAYTPLQNAITSTKKKLKELQDQHEKMEEELSSGKISAEDFEKYEKEIENTSAALKDLEKQKTELDEKFSDGHISAEQYREYQREIANTEAQLESYRSQLEAVNQQQDNNSGSGSQMVTSLEDIRSAAGKVTDDLNDFADMVKNAAKTVKDAAKEIVDYSVDVGSSFESAMSTVQAYSGASDEAFTQLESAAKEAGATTSKSATEAANALGYMALAGWDTSEMLDGLMPILRASEAGGADLATTSDLVTDSMSAMGIAVSDLTNYLDVCSAAQSNSNTTLTGLLEAYINCGGTMKNLNISVEESASWLGVLANRGIKASEAGTAFNSILVNLIGANKSASTALDTLGVSAWDSEGNFIGLTETLTLLNDALADCTEQEKSVFEAQIGGKTQMDTLQALLSGLNEEYGTLNETLNNCNGSLETTAETMQNNLTGAITIMKSSLEGVGVEVYGYLEEPMKNAVNAVTEALGKLNDSVTQGQLSDSLKNLSEKLAELIEKLADFAVSEGIPKIIDGLSGLIDLLSWMADNLGGITAAAEGLGAAWLTWKVGSLVSDVAILVTTIKSFAAAAAAGSVQAEVLATAMNTIPFVAIAAAAIGAATAIAGWINTAGDAKLAASALKTEAEKTTVEINNQTAAWEESTKAVEENCKQVDENTAAAKKSWEELQDLCDEQGNVKGSTDDAAAAIEILNDILGTNIELINDQVQGYEDLKKSMDDYIKSAEKEAKLEYMRPQYVEAVGTIDEKKKTERETRDAYWKAQTTRSNFEDQLSRADTNGEMRLTEMVRNGNNKDFVTWLERKGKKLENATAYDYLEFLKDDEQEKYNTYGAASADVRATQQTIDDYEEYAYGTDDESEKSDTMTEEEAKRTAAQADADANVAATKETIENKKSEFNSKVEQLKTMRSTHKQGMDDDAKYYAKLQEICNEYKPYLKDDEDFWKIKDDVDDYYKNKNSDTTSTDTTSTNKSTSTTTSTTTTSGNSKKDDDTDSGSGKKDDDEDEGDDDDDDDDTDTDDIEKTNPEFAKKLKGLESRKEHDPNYTQEDYIKDYNALVETLDPDSDLYKEHKANVTELAKTEFNAENDSIEHQRATHRNGMDNDDTYNAARKENADKWEGYLSDDEDFWKIKDSVDDYYADKQDKAIEDAKTEFDTLKEQLDNGLITREDFNRQYAELQKKWSENSIDISEYTAEQIEEINKNELDNWEKNVDEQMSEIEDKYKELAEKQSSIADSITSGSLYSTVTDSSGNERKVFDDLSERAEEIRKYAEDYAKLSQLDGVPADLLEEIKSMSFDERRAVVSELLKMSEKNRNAYFSDYNDWKQAAAEAAEAETADESAQLDAEAEQAAKDIFSDTPESAYDSGSDSAKAYLQGVSDYFASHGIDTSALWGNAFSDGGSVSQNTENTDNSSYISVKTPLNINIDGYGMISLTLEDMLVQKGLTGRTNSRL